MTKRTGTAEHLGGSCGAAFEQELWVEEARQEREYGAACLPAHINALAHNRAAPGKQAQTHSKPPPSSATGSHFSTRIGIGSLVEGLVLRSAVTSLRGATLRIVTCSAVNERKHPAFT